MKNRKQIIVSAALVLTAVAVVIAYALTSGETTKAEQGGHDHAAMQQAAGDDMASVSLSAENARRIGVTYAVAETGPMTSTVRTVAGVTYDETRVVNVNPKIEGWVEELYVDFTGAPIQRGAPLMAVYSPMLVSAQEELILARTLFDGAHSAESKENARNLLDAARRRLSYWDVSAQDIARIENTRKPQKTITLRSPASGVVVEKNVFRGARIMPGMDLYKIADLSTVWVEGEVFEKDLGLIKVGAPARLTFDAYPGEVFVGRVAYVYPSVAQQTRTGRVRFELRNPGTKLKPGMYANVDFVVPVHRAGLHIPRTAVLSSGTRAIVFVRHDDGTLMPHEVTVGVASGDHIEILAGLEAGQVVVASASFLVDAEANLGAAMKGMSVPAAPASNATPAPSPQPHQH